jgi:hypothetical protein
MIKILFLAANPLDTVPLLLDEEIRAIDERIRQSEYRDLFDIKQHTAARIADLQSYLLRHKPHIVHFSGYGSKSSEIILQDSSSNSQPVSVAALGQLFSILRDNIRCVVLNTCYSEKQALAIAEHIECVVGMTKSITDSAAISFASSFYQALGYGRNVRTAFELGCGQIDLHNLDEADAPKLWTLKCNPEEIVFTHFEQLTLPVSLSDTPEDSSPDRIPSFNHTTGSSEDKTRTRRTLLITVAVIMALTGGAISWVLRTQGQVKYVNPFKELQISSQALASKQSTEFDGTPTTETPQLKAELNQLEKDFDDSRYEAVITACDQMLYKDPNISRANLLLGKTYYATGNPKSGHYLDKALALGETITLEIKHHHYEGALKLNDAFCSGYFRMQKGALEFHSYNAKEHSFSLPPGRIEDLQIEKNSRLHLRIAFEEDGVFKEGNYNFYAPITVLRDSISRTKAYCDTQSCQTMAQTVYQLLQHFKP